MDYAVSSFKDAIDVTLFKLNYEPTNVEIIKKLILKALNRDINYFTNTNGARRYVLDRSNYDIENEMFNDIVKKECGNDISKRTSVINTLHEKLQTVEDLINEYINKIFVNKVTTDEILAEIDERSNLDDVTKKIRKISTTSTDDIDFHNNLWSYYSNIFIDSKNKETYYRVRYDMIKAALNFALLSRDNAGVLRTLDPNSADLTEIDAIKIVEEYVYNNEVDKLLEYMNNNTVLSGLLLQNLFNYTYYKKEELKPKKSLKDLDSELNRFEMEQTKEQMLYQIVNDKIIPEGFNLTREEVLTNILKNSLYLNIYTSNKKSMDYDERRLYTGGKNLDEKIIESRIVTNNKIANNLTINGLNTNIDDVINVINKLNSKELYFLVNMYIISRSVKENRKKLDESSYFGTKEQLHVLNILEDNKLLEKLNEKKLTK